MAGYVAPACVGENGEGWARSAGVFGVAAGRKVAGARRGAGRSGAGFACRAGEAARDVYRVSLSPGSGNEGRGSSRRLGVGLLRVGLSRRLGGGCSGWACRMGVHRTRAATARHVATGRNVVASLVAAVRSAVASDRHVAWARVDRGRRGSSQRPGVGWVGLSQGLGPAGPLARRGMSHRLGVLSCWRVSACRSDSDRDARAWRCLSRRLGVRWVALARRHGARRRSTNGVGMSRWPAAGRDARGSACRAGLQRGGSASRSGLGGFGPTWIVAPGRDDGGGAGLSR